MDADDHAFVDLVAGAHEHLAAFLDAPQRIGHRVAGFHADEHAVATLGDVTACGRIAIEHMAHQTAAAGEVHKLTLEADQATRRHAIVDAHATAAIYHHVFHFGAALTQRFHHAALMGFFDVDRERLIGLAEHAIDTTHQYLRARDGQLKAFAAHVLNEDGEMQFATTGDAKHVGVGSVFDTQRYVVLELAMQTLANLAAGNELAFTTHQR